MGLRAVVFDYGMVLTGPPERQSRDNLLRITGLDAARLDELYWANRRAYDEGKLSGFEFWQKVAGDAGLRLTPANLDELTEWDARMWTTENLPMLAWQQQLKRRGLRTAILSNMGDTVHARLEREFDWLPRFDLAVWSYQRGIAKPDPAIYRDTLTELGVQADETLFLDDKAANVEAALNVGMKALIFTTPARLRQDLVLLGLDAELPLPG